MTTSDDTPPLAGAGGGGQSPRGRDRPFRSSETRPSTPPGRRGLHGLYERYCDHEARELLNLVPREGLRAIYREARSRFRGDAPGTTAAGGGDSMGLMVRCARELLPLPPYRVWLESYLADRAPYLAAMDVASAPERPEPVLVDVRSLDAGWMAGLHLSRDDHGWRGFLRFHRPPGTESHQTADIFRGDDPDELRDRFRGFHSATLDAFLRSVLP